MDVSDDGVGRDSLLGFGIFGKVLEEGCSVEGLRDHGDLVAMPRPLLPWLIEIQLDSNAIRVVEIKGFAHQMI